MKSYVTIGIPVYNDRSYISRCIESAVNQSYEHIKIVIADNCSTDGTSEICKFYESTNSNIKYVRHGNNIGPFNNFKFLVDSCDTEYFMWLASDDWISLDFIEKASDFLVANPDYVLATATSAYYSPGDDKFLYATSTSSIESKTSHDRVIEYARNITDNSEFYGLYRLSSIRMDAPLIISTDWFMGMMTALTGKIVSIPGVSIHRNFKWSNPSRSIEVAVNDGLPLSQAESPHYATALFSFIQIANHSWRIDDKTPNLFVAWKVFKEFIATKSLPTEFSFFEDCCKFFGIQSARSYLQSIREVLKNELISISDNSLSAYEMSDILEISLTLKIWINPECIESTEIPDGDDCFRFVMNSIHQPAFMCPILPRVSSIGVNLRPKFIEYITFSVQHFLEDGHIAAYAKYIKDVLVYFDNYFFNGLDFPQIRMPSHKKDLLRHAVNNINMMSVYCFDGNVKDIMTARGRVLEKYIQISGISVDYFFQQRSEGGNRKKIALISQSLNSLTDAYTSLPAILGLDKERYEVIVYVLSPAMPGGGSVMESYVASIVDRVILLNDGSVDEIVKYIRGEDLDIILIGNNITAVSNKLTLVSCARLARYQISFNPSCVTSGFRNMDFYISGTSVDGENSQDHYLEKLLLIDGPAHTRLIPAHENIEVFSRPERLDSKVKFVSGANFYKLTPRTISTWLDILCVIPDSTLTLYPFGPAWSSNYHSGQFFNKIKSEAFKRSISIDRIQILPSFKGLDDMKEFLKTMDVYLDSFPFSGINSLLDPLSVGLPVVSLQGASFRSNMGASVLTELNLTCLLAKSVEDYIELCKRLSSDFIFYNDISRRISLNLRKSRLYDSEWCSTEFSKIFQGITEGSLVGHSR